MCNTELEWRSGQKIENFMLGHSALHARFRAIAKIIGFLTTIAPRSASVAKLMAYTGYPKRVLSTLCDELGGLGMLRPAKEEGDSWVLGSDPEAVTLEDVFHCAIESSATCGMSRLDPRGHEHDNIDLFIMQASIAVNQSMLQQLRRFPLNRLQIFASDVSLMLDDQNVSIGHR